MEAESMSKNVNGKAQGMAKQAAPAATTSATTTPSDGSMPMQGGMTEKMPFLKKWWFWAIVGAVVIALAFVLFFVM